MIERESQQHEWMFFRQHSSGNTTDAYDYCSRCGAIRARYFWKDKDGGVSHQADPQYFGVGIEDHTTNQPLCPALLAPEPEPSDAEIEAATRTLWDLHHLTLGYDDPRSDNFRELYRENTKAVLAAARAARQTGGENAK